MSGTVLIIDDSPIIREKVRKVLIAEKLFDNYVEAEDGMKGYKALFDNSVSIVICDVLMPGVDGFKFLSLKNSHEEFKTVPVIMLTGQADIKTLVKALHAGAPITSSNPLKTKNYWQGFEFTTLCGKAKML